MRTRPLPALALAAVALIAACAAPGGCPSNDPAACAGMSDGYDASADIQRQASDLYDMYDAWPQDTGPVDEWAVVREGLY